MPLIFILKSGTKRIKALTFKTGFIKWFTWIKQSVMFIQTPCVFSSSVSSFDQANNFHFSSEHICIISYIISTALCVLNILGVTWARLPLVILWCARRKAYTCCSLDWIRYGIYYLLGLLISKRVLTGCVLRLNKVLVKTVNPTCTSLGLTFYFLQSQV